MTAARLRSIEREIFLRKLAEAIKLGLPLSDAHEDAEIAVRFHRRRCGRDPRTGDLR